MATVTNVGSPNIVRMSEPEFREILQNFDAIGLEQLDSVKLQNRVDSKFVFSEDILTTVLEEVSQHYNVLTLGDIRSNKYNSLYYDTPDDLFFISHHNGKMNRFKVRYRQYMDSGICFLEVKFKNNKGRTVKKRMKVERIAEQLDENARTFLLERMGKSYDLKPALWNSFERITFAHKTNPERLTIDHLLKFALHGQEVEMSNICIAELKQEKLTNSSVFMQIMRTHGSQPSGMSKYCIGSLLLRPELKYNNFKEKLLRLNKLSNGLVPAYS
jgi:hypothetical protein